MSEHMIGPYVIEETLGIGGMGAVYRARDERLDRRVAIKTILPSKELSAERIERFRREARSTASLNHPAVAQIYDVLRQGERDFIVMEYVEGRSLEQILATEGALSAKESVHLARQIAEGLAAAHELGIVHRDLKTSNVMVDRRGRVKILDFGLAKVVRPDNQDESLTADGVVIGTCRAMSPEQAEGKKLDPRSDLFSLGSLMYEMVSGRHPFSSVAPVATMHRIVFEHPAPLTQLAPGLPPELSELIHQLLEKKRDLRPQDAAQVARALREMELRWTSAGALPTPAGDHAVPPSRTWRTVAEAALALLILGAAAFGWWLIHSADSARTVAILAPTVADGSEPRLCSRPAHELRSALEEGVGSLEQLTLVHPFEVDRASGTIDELARSLAVDELLVSEIAGCDPTCRISIRRLDRNGRAIGQSLVFEAPATDLARLHEAALETFVLAHAE